MNKITIVLFLLIVAMAMSACAPRTPEIVYVEVTTTPTNTPKPTSTPEPVLECIVILLDKISITTDTPEVIVFEFWSDDYWYNQFDISVCGLLYAK